MTSAPTTSTTLPAARTWSVSNRWWALALISLATLMVTMDTAIVAVSLPSAQRELGIPDTARQWVLTAYTLAYGGLLLLGGRLADRLGHRRTLLVGAIGFVCASALSGAALSGPMLFAGRALQGAFGALLVPSTRSLLVLIFSDPQERARALGIYTAVLIGGAIFGFILSGLITSYLDWRWTLYLNVPVAVVVALGVMRLLPEFPGDASIRIDMPGVLLGSGGMVALVYGLSEAATAGWGSTEVAAFLAAAAALLGAFVFVERQGALQHPAVRGHREEAGEQPIEGDLLAQPHNGAARGTGLRGEARLEGSTEGARGGVLHCVDPASAASTRRSTRRARERVASRRMAGVVSPRPSASRTAAETWSGAIPAAATSTIVRAGAVSRTPERRMMSASLKGCVEVWNVTPACGASRRRSRGTVR